MSEHYEKRSFDHANLSTTLRCLKTTTTAMHEALRRVEERRKPCATVALKHHPPLPSQKTPLRLVLQKFLCLRHLRVSGSPSKAPSPSGKAEVCKTSISGSNPDGASNFPKKSVDNAFLTDQLGNIWGQYAL